VLLELNTAVKIFPGELRRGLTRSLPVQQGVPLPRDGLSPARAFQTLTGVSCSLLRSLFWSCPPEDGHRFKEQFVLMQL